jgi:maltodextrin utilization protein YvdJ
MATEFDKDSFQVLFDDFLSVADVSELQQAQEKIEQQISITREQKRNAVIQEMKALAEKAGLPFNEAMFMKDDSFVYAHPTDDTLTWKGVVKGKIPEWVKTFKAEKGIDKLEDVIAHLRQVPKSKRARKTA